MKLISIQIKYEGKHKFFIINNSIHLITKVIKENKKKILTNLALNGYDGYTRINIPENHIKFIYPYLVVGDDVYKANMHNNKTTIGYETNNLMSKQLKNAKYKDGEVYYIYQEPSHYYWDSGVDYDYPIANDYYNNVSTRYEALLNDPTNSYYFDTNITYQSTINTEQYNDYSSSIKEINDQSNSFADLYKKPKYCDTLTNSSTYNGLLPEDYTNILYMIDTLKETNKILNQENKDLIKQINKFKSQTENIEFMYQEIKIKNEELELENQKLKEDFSTINDSIDNLIGEL
jgi:FtsZ-binding cell division protein ZapB